MAFQSVSGNTPPKRKFVAGSIRKHSKTGDLYLKVEDDATLILYKDGEYYQLNRAKIVDVGDGKVLFNIEVNLDSPDQVTFKAKD